MRLLNVLTAEPFDKGTPHFDAPNLEIVSVDVGNPAFNVVPAEARARVNVRFNDLWTPETLAAELCGRLDSAGMKFTLEFEPCNAPAFLTTPDSFTKLVADAVERKTGRRPALSTSVGKSDASVRKCLNRPPRPPLRLGPGLGPWRGLRGRPRPRSSSRPPGREGGRVN
jgi:succinyl-diaminopimelate desuccinylase